MIPTTSAPAFSPGSYGTLKLLGRFEFCRFSSFCLSCEITVIVKSMQVLCEFKKLPILSVTFPEASSTSVHNILYICSGYGIEEKGILTIEELTIQGCKKSQAYCEQYYHVHI